MAHFAQALTANVGHVVRELQAVHALSGLHALPEGKRIFTSLAYLVTRESHPTGRTVHVQQCGCGGGSHHERHPGALRFVVKGQTSWSRSCPPPRPRQAQWRSCCRSCRRAQWWATWRRSRRCRPRERRAVRLGPRRCSCAVRARWRCSRSRGRTCTPSCRSRPSAPSPPSPSSAPPGSAASSPRSVIETPPTPAFRVRLSILTSRASAPQPQRRQPHLPRPHLLSLSARPQLPVRAASSRKVAQRPSPFLAAAAIIANRAAHPRASLRRRARSPL